MNRLRNRIEGSQLYIFAREAHNARFPAYAWKAVACDMIGIPVGSRPTLAQMTDQPHNWSTMWLELTLRFDQMSTVRWAEHEECEQERLHNALVHLGASPDTVASRLAMMGVMGDMKESCDCPVSHFFMGVYGAWFATVYSGDSFVDFMPVNNPHAVDVFVNQFDEGRRPALDLFPDRNVIR